MSEDEIIKLKGTLRLTRDEYERHMQCAKEHIDTDDIGQAVAHLLQAKAAQAAMRQLKFFISERVEERMKELQAWVEEHGQLINSEDCPMFNMENPTEEDLKKCGMICSTKWSCHTYRHIHGTREES